MSSKRLFGTQATKDLLKTVYGASRAGRYRSRRPTFETYDDRRAVQISLDRPSKQSEPTIGNVPVNISDLFGDVPVLGAARRPRGQGNASCAAFAAFMSDRGFGVIRRLCTFCLNILTMTRLHPKGGAIARACNTD